LFGPDGNLYVGDYGDGSVKRYNGTTGAFSNAFVSSGSGGLGGPTFLIFTPATNSWTNSVSGKWETGVNWSLRVPPSTSDGADLITNAANKTVTIDSSTSGLPLTMIINNLLLSAPVNSTNTLLLSNAGTNTPLRVLHSCNIANGGVLRITNSVFQVEGTGAFDIDGAASLQSGSLVALYPVTTRIGNVGKGSLTVSNGTALFDYLIIGSNAVSQGALTAAGGTTTVLSTLDIADHLTATGAVWVTGGKLDLALLNVGRFGVGQMITSNGTAQSTGLVTVGLQSSARGSLTVAGGTNIFSSLHIAESNGAIASVLVSGAGLLQVNNELENHGSFTVAGGTANILGDFDSLRAANAVWVTGGQLAATNGNAVVGQVAVSNGTFLARDLFIGNSDIGTVTVAGGLLALPGSFNGMIVGGNGGTGTVWQTGGQIITTNTDISIGGLFSPAVGRMTVSNGTMLAKNLFVAAQSSGLGTFTAAGGTNSVYTSLILGDDFCVGTGTVVVASGRLFVTNAAGNAALEVHSGTLAISGGLLQANKIVISNACAHFSRTGGVLTYGAAFLVSTRDDDGDGIPNGYEQSNGLDPLDPANATKDSDGDGLTDLQEFLAGTSPTNSASAFRITSIVRTNNNIRITWATAGGHTNRVLVATPVPGGSFTNEFNNLSSFIIIPGAGDTSTNYLDVGGATNVPSRYYRIRLVP
jgi:hypothetical protein